MNNDIKSPSSSSSVSGEQPNRKGLSVVSATIFIAGELAGSGILAIPKAAVDCGWIGLVLIIVFCLNSGYCGTRLSHCWTILEERYPEYKNSNREPYPAIAYRAVGSWGSIIVTVCVQFTLFGASVVYLLLSAQIIQEMLQVFFPNISYCLWYLLIALFVIPIMWLGSPKDFGFAGIGALLTTAISCALITYQILKEGVEHGVVAEHKPHTLKEFFLSFGVILFSYGGASTFPTIQNDMYRRDKFSKSVVYGYIIILLIYLPPAFGAFFVYGDDVQSNVLMSLDKGIIVSTANILMAIHLILAFFIVINPVSQQIEEIFRVPHDFCLKRCIVRTLMVLLMVVVGETIPKFNMVLALVGGSTVTLATFVLPPYFYMKLCDQKSPTWKERHIPLYARVYMWELILIGIVGGVASTYSAAMEIFKADSIIKPCYWPDN